MSELERLIQEHCSNGVEFVNLGDICDIRTGKLNANAMVEDGEYPFFTCDATPYRIDKYAFDTDAILISGNGSQVGHLHKYKGKFNAYQRTYVLDNFDDALTKDFLYHFLGAYLKPYILVNCKKGSVPYITLPMLQNFRIPVPPIGVQGEIVRILDNFTELTAELAAELTAELTARRKQYDYCRDALLDNANNARSLALGDIAKIKNGRDYKSLNSGTIPVYGSGGVMTYVDEYAYDKPTVLIPRKGSVDKLYYVETPFWNVDTIFYTDINVDIIIPKYLFYLLQKEHLEQYNTAGGVPSLTQGVLNKVQLLVPSIDEQKRIVDILDRFDVLCNDISAGLPAEIEARQKQYEYYRDKLLTFKESGC